ncbi:MAG TPA: hypothetical protein VNA20_15850 [Frankiaceae bacterium]|nr:hypothetical protein [Frankiaceae bacterium]
MRLPLVAALTAVALASSASGAAPKPQITDATADQLPVAGAGYDVVSALFATSGTTTKVKKKKIYTPTKLVITLTYAGDVPTDEYATQVVEFDAPGCSDIYLQAYAATTATYGQGDCLPEDTSVSFNAKAAGKTMTFTLPLNLFGAGVLKAGTSLTNLVTYTAYAEPVLGIEPGFVGPEAQVDHAETAAAYRVA